MKNRFVTLIVLAMLAASVFSVYYPEIEMKIDPGLFEEIPKVGTEPEAGMLGGLVIVPGIFLLPNTVELSATRELPRLLYIEAAKVSSSDKYDIVGHYFAKPVGETEYESHIYVYSVSGGTISLVAQKEYQYAGRDTRLVDISNPYTGKLMIGGSYHYSSGNFYPHLAQMTYSGASLGTPVTQSLSGLPTSTKRKIISIDSGNVAGDSSSDTVMALREGTGDDTAAAVAVKSSLGNMHYPVSEYYYYDEVVVGDFSTASGNEFAYVSYDPELNKVAIYLFKVEAGAISKLSSKKFFTSDNHELLNQKAAAADLDNDGYDELLVAGAYEITNSGMWDSYSDAVQVYKYSDTTGWYIKNEYLDTTGSDNGVAVDISAVDMDSDGDSEVIAINEYYYDGTGGSVARVLVDKYQYNEESDMEHLSTAVIAPSSPAHDNYYSHKSSAFADFTGDGRTDLALVYYDKADTTYKLAIYKLGKDTTKPEVEITAPSIDTFENEGALKVTVNVEDVAKVDDSSVKVKLTGPEGYDSGYVATEKSMVFCIFGFKCPPGTSYNADLDLTGLEPGEYTIGAEAKDNSDNLGTDTKEITITAEGVEPEPEETNATNETEIEPEVIPEAEPELEPVAEPEPEPSVEAEPEPSEEAEAEPEAISEEPEAAGEEPGEEATGEEPEADAQTQAEELIQELEIKITVAHEQGYDTSEMADALDEARQHQQEGRYVEAALEAQKGVTQADEALVGQEPEPDYTPYLVGALIIIVLAVGYMMLNKPAPAKAPGKSKKGKGGEE